MFLPSQQSQLKKKKILVICKHTIDSKCLERKKKKKSQKRLRRKKKRKRARASAWRHTHVVGRSKRAAIPLPTVTLWEQD